MLTIAGGIVLGVVFLIFGYFLLRFAALLFFEGCDYIVDPPAGERSEPNKDRSNKIGVVLFCVFFIGAVAFAIIEGTDLATR